MCLLQQVLPSECFLNRKHTAKAGLMGATAGIVAGSVAAATYEYVTSKEKLPYYSELSPLYDEI